MEASSKSTESAERVAASKPRSKAETVDHTQRLCELAHERLREMLLRAIGNRFFGQVTITVSFEGGRPHLVRHRIDGIDKLRGT